MAAPMSNANMPDVHCIRKMVKDNLVSLMESVIVVNYIFSKTT